MILSQTEMQLKRIMKQVIYIIHFILFTSSYSLWSQKIAPSRLSINFLSQADRVFSDGYPTNTPLYKAVDRKESFQFTEIAQNRPFFGWVVNSEDPNTLQTAYQILVASSIDFINKNEGDMWDSGKVENDQSSNVSYSGARLQPNKVYFWKVKTWDNHGRESSFSSSSQFKMAEYLVDYATARYPIQKQDDYPISLTKLSNANVLADFGKDTFGRVRLTLFGKSDSDSVTIHLGENAKNGIVDRIPKGTIRYSKYKIPLMRGWNTYTICIEPNSRNIGRATIRVPGYIGEVLPFRYCEIEGYDDAIEKHQIVRETAFYPFDEMDSYFSSSDSILNQIWEISKHTMKATSFTGVFIDSDRERIPYEGDVYMNQLAYYGVSKEYSIARYTNDYLMDYPTWPTEWAFHAIMSAWYDYLYTGNIEALTKFYNDLKPKTLIALANDQGFVVSNGKKSTPNIEGNKVTPQLLKDLKFDHPKFIFKQPLKDLVDWPPPGFMGVEYDGTDGYVFKDVNTVVNAYHYKGLDLMGKIANVLGERYDEEFYQEHAEKFKKVFNEVLIDDSGLVVDGIGTDHNSLHANMFPLSLGVINDENKNEILRFIKSKGMACHIYGSLILLNALYENDYSGYALDLLTSTSVTSWYNMIRAGSTMTMEAWDVEYKPNCGWNQPAGSVPAYIIPAKLMGIEPLEPGFRRIRIKPQPASLENAEIKFPTIRGSVNVSFKNKQKESFVLDIETPANTLADVYLPDISKKHSIYRNGKKVKGVRENGFVIMKDIGSGKNHFEVRIN